MNMYVGQGVCMYNSFTPPPHPPPIDMADGLAQ